MSFNDVEEEEARSAARELRISLKADQLKLAFDGFFGETHSLKKKKRRKNKEKY